jgi:histidine kinase
MLGWVGLLVVIMCSAFQFTGIVRKILSKSKNQVDRWRERLLTALGSNGQVVIDLIPELQELVGRLPPVQPLPPLESSHRLNVAMASILETLAGAQHSLVLFLDDVQWADPASLRLLRYAHSAL